MSPTLHFLIDASLPRATAGHIQNAGHQATDVRDIGLGAADDRRIAAHSRQQRYCLITRDAGFGNVLDYPPQDYFGIVVVEVPRRAGTAIVLNLVDEFLQQSSILSLLSGRLAVIEPGQIRLRPP
jgi:predicted nuclease of predicted toxin-antitoxin system